MCLHFCTAFQQVAQVHKSNRALTGVSSGSMGLSLQASSLVHVAFGRLWHLITMTATGISREFVEPTCCICMPRGRPQSSGAHRSQAHCDASAGIKLGHLLHKGRLRPASCCMCRHRDGVWRSADEVPLTPAGRIKAHIALDGHGSYPEAGFIPRVYFAFNDLTSNQGVQACSCSLMPYSKGTGRQHL